MAPQRLPRPGAGTPQTPPEPPSPSTAGQDFVDRALLPPRLSDAQIAAMTVEDARTALEAIDNTNGWNIDGHSRARLDHEREQLLLRINGAPSS